MLRPAKMEVFLSSVGLAAEWRSTEDAGRCFWMSFGVLFVLFGATLVPCGATLVPSGCYGCQKGGIAILRWTHCGVTLNRGCQEAFLDAIWRVVGVIWSRSDAVWPPLVPGWGLLLVKMELSQFEVWAWSRHRHETDHDRETLNY